MSVRTRFAPSPTGFLHIGGVRTALFNWLLARHFGGQFILRIDDTDQQRHVDDAVRLILDGFQWMGMDFDEGPVVGGAVRPVLPIPARRTLQESRRCPDRRRSCLSRLQQRSGTRRRKGRGRRRQAHLSLSRQGRLRRRPRPVRSRRTPYALRFRVPMGRSVIVHDKIKGDVEQKTPKSATS